MRAVEKGSTSLSLSSVFLLPFVSYYFCKTEFAGLVDQPAFRQDENPKKWRKEFHESQVYWESL